MGGWRRRRASGLPLLRVREAFRAYVRFLPSASPSGFLRAGLSRGTASPSRWRRGLPVGVCGPFPKPPHPLSGGGRGPRVRAAGLCGGPLAPRGGRPVCLTRRSAFPGWCSCRPLSLRVPHGVGGGRRSPRGFVSLVWAWSPTGRSLRTVPPPPASRAPIGLLRGLTDSTCRVRWPEGAARRLVRCRRGLARLFRNLNPKRGAGGFALVVPSRASGYPTLLSPPGRGGGFNDSCPAAAAGWSARGFCRLVEKTPESLNCGALNKQKN